MLPLLFLALASAPASPAERPSVGIVGGLVLANGVSPGDAAGLLAGARLASSHFSVGLEFQFLPPGRHAFSSSELPSFRLRATEPILIGSEGFGLVGQLPLCFRFGPLSACGVASVGAVSVRPLGSALGGMWLPLVSAGLRLTGEAPTLGPVRLCGSVQVMGGVVRPEDASWAASPVQLAAALGVLFDAL